MTVNIWSRQHIVPSSCVRRSCWERRNYHGRQRRRDGLNSSSGYACTSACGRRSSKNGMACKTVTSALCNQCAETVSHLLLGCVVSRQVWHLILGPIGLAAMAPNEEDELPDWWLHQRALISEELQPAFDSITLLINWAVWKERYTRVFRNLAKNRMEIARRIEDELGEWVQAGFSSLLVVYALWSQSSGNE